MNFQVVEGWIYDSNGDEIEKIYRSLRLLRTLIYRQLLKKKTEKYDLLGDVSEIIKYLIQFLNTLMNLFISKLFPD